MPKFLTPINLSNLEIQNFLLQNVPTASLPTTNRAGQILYDSTVNRPKWNNGSGFIDIYPSDTANTTNTEVRRDSSGNFAAGTITANLTGVASQATILANSRNIGISGTKVTATAASFNGSADVNINITALSVAVGDIALASGSFIVGSAGNVGSATTKSSIPLSGFGAAAADVAMGSYKITGLSDPVNAQDAATKAYVDATAQGLDVKQSVVVATTAALTAAYVGSPTFTLTNSGAQSGLTIDGLPLSVGNRVLVKNQADTSTNGIYVVTSTGGASANWILTRASDFNTSAEISSGSFTFVEQGTAYGDTGWVMTTNGVPVLDTTGFIWAQFSGAGAYTGGRGIVQVGTEFHFAQSSNYSVGDIPYASGTTSIGMLAAVAAGNALISNGVGTAPSWGRISTGTLAQINAISVLCNAGPSTANVSTVAGTADQVLRINAAGNALAFGAINIGNAAAVSGTLTVSNGGTGMSTVGSQYTVLYSTGSAIAYGTVDLNNMTSGTLPVAKGGTGSTFFTVAGPTATRTYTFKDQNANIPALFAAQITADSSTTAFAITHSLGTKDVIVAVYEISTGARVYTDDTATSTSVVTVTFAVAPPSGTNYRVVIVGF